MTGLLKDMWLTVGTTIGCGIGFLWAAIRTGVEIGVETHDEIFKD